MLSFFGNPVNANKMLLVLVTRCQQCPLTSLNLGTNLISILCIHV